ncbi:MAG: ABC transporter ATP-binding protein [Hymenobacteraceae bacterium]|nr:ABC transporter ATP-binding protein [Hymenobacteraceae bacterium]
MKTYWRILQFARPFRGFVPAYVVLTVLGVGFGLLNFTLIIPLLNVLFGTTEKEAAAAMSAPPAFALTLDWASRWFNYQVGRQILEHGKVAALGLVCGVIVASVFLANLFKYLALRLIVDVRADVIRKLRTALYQRLLTLQLGYFSTERKGDLMSRLTNDVQEVENSVVSTLTAVIREPVTLVGFFILLLTMSVRLTLLTLVILPVSGFIISLLAKRLKRRAQEGQHVLGTMLTVLDETLSGIRVIKGFNAENWMLGKFHDENNRYARLVRSMGNARDAASPLSEFLGVTAVAGILFLGGRLVLAGDSDLSPSEFITYIVLFSQILVPAKALSGAFSNIQRGLVAGGRILAVVDVESTVRDAPGAVVAPAFAESVRFEGVSFRYPGLDHDVLHAIDLTVARGQTVALVGASGGGKSTMLDLVPRFYDPTAGRVLLDGRDLRELTLESVRAQMGIVTQESILFNDTIFANIAFNSPGATPETVEAAARVANAHEFIERQPQGYQTVIGDRGARLSGGQRQRLAIARAILRNPPILILDEATSALDTESERLVQDALTRLMRGRTTLVIAHRLSTIRHADEIVVLIGGRIVERGTHEALLRNPMGAYYRLSLLQENSFSILD